MTPEDIKRINYIYYTSHSGLVKNPHSLLVCYLLFFLRTIWYILHFHFKYKKFGELLMVLPSLNNKKSVRTVCENLSIPYTVWGGKNDFPNALIYLRSFIGFPCFQKLYNSSSKEEKKLIRQFYLNFMGAYGYYNTFRYVIKKNPQLKMIILANDHTTLCRSLIELAEEHSIKSLYVQHASITKKFPPLHFTYSFLDGMESYEKYQDIGDMRGLVFLSGSPRFDEMYKYKNEEKKYDVGIALNMMDSCDKVLELCNFLKKNYSKSIIVRPHPLMSKLFDSQLFSKNDIDISDSTQESSFSFLSKLNFLVANESGIHLDSALIGVPSLLYNFSDNKVLDWYSYIKRGLIQVCDKYDDVLKVFKDQRGLPVDKIQYYNASLGTQIEGNVGAFVANFINALMSSSEEEALNILGRVMEQRNGYFAIRNY